MKIPALRELDAAVNLNPNVMIQSPRYPRLAFVSVFGVVK